MAAREFIEVSEVMELEALHYRYLGSNDDRTGQINAYLAAGWKLLDTYVCGRGDLERREKHFYVLGWPTALGTAVHPKFERIPLTEAERML